MSRTRPPNPNLDDLRQWRVWPERGRPIGVELERVQKHVERTDRRLGEFLEAWTESVPPALREQTRVASYRAGTMHVIVASSGVLFEVDRLLREGLEGTLRRRVKGTLARVKLSIGPLIDPVISSE